METNRKLWAICRKAPFIMTLNYLEGHFNCLQVSGFSIPIFCKIAYNYTSRIYRYKRLKVTQYCYYHCYCCCCCYCCYCVRPEVLFNSTQIY